MSPIETLWNYFTCTVLHVNEYSWTFGLIQYYAT